MPEIISDVISWATDLDPRAAEQAARTSRLPVVTGHVALMADAHVGLGATVGSVVPTEGAIIPACVDIGCGMAAVRTDLVAGDLPDGLKPMLTGIGKAIPAGVGRGHEGRAVSGAADRRRRAASRGLRPASRGAGPRSAPVGRRRHAAGHRSDDVAR